jgi:hypothetical protein
MEKMQAASDAMKKMKTEHLDAIAEMEASWAPRPIPFLLLCRVAPA